MAISFRKLHEIAAGLEAYRLRGENRLVIFDGRDHGNYLGYQWDSQAEMLERFDPTGLALGMLLAEMIEATIIGSQVSLSRVLREPDFLARLQEVQRLEGDLLADLGEPRARLLDRLNASLGRTSPEYEDLTTREVAICLRDAIYSLDCGLSLRWLRCDDVPMSSSVPIGDELRHFGSLPDFIDALRSELSNGAHLARIGASNTVIGIKQPGRIAYLSSFEIINGSLHERRASNYHMAESLDLDTAVERYPDWIKKEYSSSYGHEVTPTKPGSTHHLNRISLLPRDRLVWLAMVVEMAAQTMSKTDPKQVTLAETMCRALAGAGPINSGLPAVIKPNWSLGDLSIKAAFESFGFSEWEAKFLRPALAGLDEDAFFRVQSEGYGIAFESRSIVPWVSPGSFGESDMRAKHCELTPASPDLAGTRAEVAAARIKLFETNLLSWLMEWGNYQFRKQWKENVKLLSDTLRTALPGAANSACVTWKAPAFRDITAEHLYAQNPKRVTYSPRCVLDPRKEVTTIAHFLPSSSFDLVQMLGLQDESELPEFLRGWRREQSWTTRGRSPGGAGPGPHGVLHQWCFAADHRNDHERLSTSFTVCLNEDRLAAASRMAPSNQGLPAAIGSAQKRSRRPS